MGWGKVAISSFLISVTALAKQPNPGYELIQFSNSSFVTTTTAELSNMIGSDSALLPSMNCDSSQEFQLFGSSPKPSFYDDSLRAMAIEDGKDTEFIVKHGQLLRHDGSNASNSTNTWVQSLSATLSRLNNLSLGHILLNEMEHSPYAVILRSGASHFSPTETNGKPGMGLSMATTLMNFNTLFISSQFPIYQLGVGGDRTESIGKYVRIESDDQVRPVSPLVSLAHEMYHAYDSVRGLLDVRMVKGQNYEMAAVAEYRAVFFEDQIRIALNMLPAKYYSETDPAAAAAKKVPPMLGPDGQPRTIPAPCL